MNTNQISAEVVMMDRSIASTLLKKNTTNRPLLDSRVNKYANQMKGGLWMLNGEPVIIGSDGTLIDGQHRLTGIVKYDLKVPMLVCQGVDPTSIGTVDIGDSRTGKDVLVIEDNIGPQVAGALASCIRFDIMMKHSGSFTNNGRYAHLVMPNEIVRVNKEEPGYLRAVEFVKSFGRDARILPHGLLSFLAYRFHKIKGDRSDSWMEGLLSGTDLGKDDMRLHVRNYIIADRQSARRRSTNSKALAVIRIWKAAMDGRSLKKCTIFNLNSVNPLPYIRLETDIYKATKQGKSNGVNH